jgi:hypothetical protein
LEDLQTAPSTQTLRQFAMLWIIFFGGISGWKLVSEGPATAGFAFLVAALTVGPLGLWAPQRIRWIFMGWRALAFPIGWTISFLLLAAVFYGLFTPLGLWFRLTGRDALRLRRPQEDTCWTRKPAAQDPAEYFRQF